MKQRDRKIKYLFNELALGCILMLVLLSTCQACEYVATGLWSYHYNRDKDWTEDHQRVGCENILGSGVNASYFVNSHGDDSALVSKYWTWKQKGNVSLGLEYGIVYGYKHRLANIAGFAPALLPRLSWQGDTIGVDLFVAYNQALAIGFKWKLGE